MFDVTPESHALLSLFIMAVAFLIAQIITHPAEEPAPVPHPVTKEA
ncbi:MAG: hypothetical protein ACOY94_25970 [Bacillota bacterium]